MTKIKQISKRVLMIIILIFIYKCSFAQITITILQTSTGSDVLKFGTVAAYGSGSFTVTVPPSGSTRTTSTNVFLDPNATWGAMSFTVSNGTSKNYSFTLSIAPTSSQSGQVSVGGFTYSPSGPTYYITKKTGSIPTPYVILVGGTLTVSSGYTKGLFTFTNSFTITIGNITPY